MHTATDRVGNPGKRSDNKHSIIYIITFLHLKVIKFVFENFYTHAVSYIYLREGWDLRATILQGKRLRMERYLIKSIFDLLIRIRDSNRQNPNVTQVSVCPIRLDETGLFVLV